MRLLIFHFGLIYLYADCDDPNMRTRQLLPTTKTRPLRSIHSKSVTINKFTDKKKIKPSKKKDQGKPILGLGISKRTNRITQLPARFSN